MGPLTPNKQNKQNKNLVQQSTRIVSYLSKLQTMFKLIAVAYL